MGNLKALLFCLSSFAIMSCSGNPGNEATALNETDAPANIATNSVSNSAELRGAKVDPSWEWRAAGPDCPIETTPWSVTIEEQPGRTRPIMHVIGYVRSTSAGMMASTLGPGPSGRWAAPEQHFELGPLRANYPQGQAETLFIDYPLNPGVNVVVIDCDGKEIARVTKFARITPKP